MGGLFSLSANSFKRDFLFSLYGLFHKIRLLNWELFIVLNDEPKVLGDKVFCRYKGQRIKEMPSSKKSPKAQVNQSALGSFSFFAKKIVRSSSSWKGQLLSSFFGN